MTDAALAATPVIASVTELLAAAGLRARVFGGVHPNPTTADLAAVNPQRGRGLDYRSDFAAAVLDPELTVGLLPGPTAATGMDALTHAVESYLSVRANPWSAGIALQVIRMVSEFLPRAVADGTDREARAQMLLAAHMAGLAMATTGIGAAHAIGHALGGRFDVTHGVALTMVLPAVLAFSQPACGARLADVAFALGAGDTAAPADVNAGAAVHAIASLAASVGMVHNLADFGIGAPDFGQIAADALDDEVLANAPRQPSDSDITDIMDAAGG